MLAGAVDVPTELPALRAIVTLRTDGPASWDAFLASGDPVDPAVIDARVDALTADDLSDILFTSGTTGNPKGVMETHGATLRAFAAWSEVVGLREGDRYLIVNPFFHAFGYKAGWLTRAHHRRHDPSPSRLRRRRGARARQPGADHDAAGAADALPHDPGSSSAWGVRPLEPAPGRDRRRRDPGRADRAHARGAQLRDDHHRLRTHRILRDRDDVPVRRRPRDDRDDERARRFPTSRSSSSTSTGANDRAASPARWSSAATT